MLGELTDPADLPARPRRVTDTAGLGFNTKFAKAFTFDLQWNWSKTNGTDARTTTRMQNAAPNHLDVRVQR